MSESFEPSRTVNPTVVDYRLWVNKQGTVLVRQWGDGTIEVALRDHAHDLWGAPVTLTEEVYP